MSEKFTEYVKENNKVSAEFSLRCDKILRKEKKKSHPPSIIK